MLAGGGDCPGLHAVVAIGGDGTMVIAHKSRHIDLPMVGVLKTIDNDLFHTERTFGFDSAEALLAEALDRLTTTACSHGRVMIVETIGRLLAGSRWKAAWHHAAQLVASARFGHMVALQSDACTHVPLAEVAGKNRLVPANDALPVAARGTGVVLGD